MGWFRSNSGKFAWVAFFALACQFALTFVAMTHSPD
jgi:hypothetical protein